MKKSARKMKSLNYTPKDFVLSFQHMVAMLGATILVPILGGMAVPMALIAAGLGTICFYFLTKRKVPVFLGSSFAFLPALISLVGVGSGLTKFTAGWNKAMAGVVIALFLAGLVYMIMSLLIKFVGVKKIKKFFPPIVVGPVIIIIGMILAPKMFYNNIIGQYLANPAAAWKHWTAAIVTILTIVGINSFARPKSFLKVIPILLGFVVGYIYALIISYIPDAPGMTATKLVDFSAVWNNNYKAVDNILVFQNMGRYFGFYGKSGMGSLDGATFGAAAIAIIPIALVTFMEHLGDISANSAVCGKDFMVDPGLHRTVLGDGVATSLAAMLGAPANTTYGENTAVLAITQNYSTRNIFAAACMAVVFGVFSIFGDFLRTIPASVIGGASIILFGMISASGLRSLIEAKVDFSNTKNLMVVSTILALGLGLGAMSLAGDVTQNTLFKVGFATKTGGFVEISPLAIATVIGIILNLIIPYRKPLSDEQKEAFKKGTKNTLAPSIGVDIDALKKEEYTLEGKDWDKSKKEKSEKVEDKD